jgi:hypothetical protein
MEANLEFEVGTCETGVLITLKTRDGRLHRSWSIEMTEAEALQLAKVLTRGVEDRQAKLQADVENGEETLN